MSHLKFAHIEYSISTKSLDLFTIGCGKGITNLNCEEYDGCKDCCNPEIRDWNVEGFGIPQVIAKVYQLNAKFNKLIDRILIVGGDPADAYFRYKDEMTEFLRQLRTVGKPLYLFTRHELPSIPRELLELVDYVKTGAYIPELKCDDNIQDGIKLATSNQKIFKVSDILQGEEDESYEICK